MRRILLGATGLALAFGELGVWAAEAFAQSPQTTPTDLSTALRARSMQASSCGSRYPAVAEHLMQLRLHVDAGQLRRLQIDSVKPPLNLDNCVLDVFQQGSYPADTSATFSHAVKFIPP